MWGRSGNMVSDKALYMLAVGVLAVGVGQRYTNEGRAWAQCALHEVQHITRQASTEALAYLGNNRPVPGGREVRVDERVQLAVARVQARVDRAQAKIDRRSAQIARATAALSRVNARMADINVQAVEIPQPNVRLHCQAEE